MKHKRRIPVAILTGFLGSGKTTLLNKYLKSPSVLPTLVIVNEFGEIGIDHLLVETADEDMILLSNGCVCCSAHGDLVLTMTRLLERRWRGDKPDFEQIVIETTGVADPVPLIRTILSNYRLSPHLSLTSIVCVVDAIGGVANLENHFECVKQVIAADQIVVSKTDMVESVAFSALEERIRAFNADCRITLRHAPEFDVKRCFARTNRSKGKFSWFDQEEEVEAAAAAGRPRTRHGGVQSCSFERPGVASKEAFRLWLNTVARFGGSNLLRVKGIINVEDTPVVVHGVQNIFHEPEILKHWPSGEKKTKVVFVGYDLQKGELEKSLDLLGFGMVGGIEGPLGFDIKRYASFVQLVSAASGIG
jgi:G3E family GTPase